MPLKKCKWTSCDRPILEPGRKYCSRKCAGLGRKYLDPVAAAKRVEQARTAAEASALARAARTAERWQNVSPQVAWERGYGAGWYAGRKAALALGGSSPPPAPSPEE